MAIPMTIPVTSAQRHIGNLAASFATIAACDIAFGMTFQLQPLLMEEQGIPAWIIGSMISMGPLGILIAGPFLPRIIARFGSKRTSLAAILTILATLILFKISPPLWWWFILRFIFGIAVGTLFTVSEAWVVTFSDENSRGQTMGLYSSLLSVSFGIGPLLLPYTGINGWLPWAICVVCVALSIIPLFFVDVRDESRTESHASIVSVMRMQPLIFACAIAATMFDSITISFFTIFAIRSGVPLDAASTILAFGIIGCVFFYVPLGILADRWSRNGVVAICALTSIATAMLMIPAIQTPAIWPLLLILCLTAFGVYVVALSAIGTVFKGNDIVAASAAIAATWGIGGIIGPPVAGRLIDKFGVNALPLSIAAIYVVLSLGLALNRWQLIQQPSRAT
jgi:MFS family permease